MTGGRSRPRRRWSALERELRAGGGALIAGVDEVGRGPLAGPVVACAVVMPPDAPAIRGVDDSKRLAPAERVRLAALIHARAISVGIGAASVVEIDRVNIYHATVLAMRRAKLYYLHHLTGKATRIREKKVRTAPTVERAAK